MSTPRDRRPRAGEHPGVGRRGPADHAAGGHPGRGQRAEAGAHRRRRRDRDAGAGAGHASRATPSTGARSSSTGATSGSCPRRPRAQRHAGARGAARPRPRGPGEGLPDGRRPAPGRPGPRPPPRSTPRCSRARRAGGPRAGADLRRLLLGMGGEGHTASVFPHSPAVYETERSVVARARLPEAAAHARLADPARDPQGAPRCGSSRPATPRPARWRSRWAGRARWRSRWPGPAGSAAPGGCSTARRRPSCRATSCRTLPGRPSPNGTSWWTARRGRVAPGRLLARPGRGGPPAWPAASSRRSSRGPKTSWSCSTAPPRIGRDRRLGPRGTRPCRCTLCSRARRAPSRTCRPIPLLDVVHAPADGDSAIVDAGRSELVDRAGAGDGGDGRPRAARPGAGGRRGGRRPRHVPARPSLKPGPID